MIVRLTLAAVLLATPALAQPGPPPGGPGDHPGPEQVFISPAGEPFRAPPGAAYPIAVWFAQADKDGDGAITREEFTADSLAFFDKLDTDHDGWVDGFEVGAYEKEVAPEISMRGLPRARTPGEGLPNRPVGGRRPIGGTDARGRPVKAGKDASPADLGRSGAGLFGLINEVQPVMAQDSDFNRRIDKAEATAAARDRFRILDKDKSGRLTLDSLPTTPMQRWLEEQSGEE